VYPSRAQILNSLSIDQTQPDPLELDPVSTRDAAKPLPDHTEHDLNLTFGTPVFPSAARIDRNPSRSSRTPMVFRRFSSSSITRIVCIGMAIPA
jgi:hypothetical protein